MNKNILLVLALAALAAPFAGYAHARPNPAPGTASAPVHTSGPSTALPAQPDCAAKLAALVGKLKAPGNHPSTTAQSTLLWHSSAYAESCGGGAGFCGDPELTTSGNELVGTSRVAKGSGTSLSDLPFRILPASGKAMIKWNFAGKQHSSTVDSCSGGIWTATSSTAAIAIHIDEVLPVVVPE